MPPSAPPWPDGRRVLPGLQAAYFLSAAQLGLEPALPIAHHMHMLPDPSRVSPDPVAPRGPRVGLLAHPVLLAVVLICIGVELGLQGADRGLWGSLRWRALAYQNGGFWAGLLDNWQPNYPGQPALMFLTYGFLHGGAGHAGVNMVTLISLGVPVADRLGAWRFVGLYAVALLGGAVAFALLSPAVQPMVGASGALFGLAGALLAWEHRQRRQMANTQLPLVGAILGLGLLNAVMFWWLGGLLAWETHLGGFLAGGLAALMLDRPRLANTRS